jgi:hypothetical protein
MTTERKPPMFSLNASAIASRILPGLLAVVALLNTGAADGHLDEPKTEAADATASQGMYFYSLHEQVDFPNLKPIDSSVDLGGRVLSGNPQLYSRVDHNANGMMAGLFMATTGVVEIKFPFSEHATILRGEVTLTDVATGQTRSLKAGDSYFVRQGQVVIWDVKGKYVVKSFFNVVTPTPAP